MERRALVDAYRASGQSMREFCRTRAVSKSSLSRWFHHFGYGCQRPRCAKRQLKGDTVVHGSAPVEVELPDGLIVRFPVDTSPSLRRGSDCGVDRLGSRPRRATL